MWAFYGRKKWSYFLFFKVEYEEMVSNGSKFAHFDEKMEIFIFFWKKNYGKKIVGFTTNKMTGDFLWNFCSKYFLPPSFMVVNP